MLAYWRVGPTNTAICRWRRSQRGKWWRHLSCCGRTHISIILTFHNASFSKKERKKNCKCFQSPKAANEPRLAKFAAMWTLHMQVQRQINLCHAGEGALKARTGSGSAEHFCCILFGLVSCKYTAPLKTRGGVEKKSLDTHTHSHLNTHTRGQVWGTSSQEEAQRRQWGKQVKEGGSPCHLGQDWRADDPWQIFKKLSVSSQLWTKMKY